ncbi:hypothetical protein LUZ61_020535 [Rhynchospora tenuis]|uniref:Pentatricopeptide repeat-containing protein-mitochondrial domain-containing protein n=1 Tax=Rhynchospora tenuis TaxID=198213 RepID=A0AAD5ZDG6_9POAL|nr:hypothetical protein LUZ61_020535 [Rhynchospora tenuis]
MHRYLRLKSIANWSIGLPKISPFLQKIQLKSNPSFRYFSAVALLSQNLDYSSGEDKESFFPIQRTCFFDSTQVCNNLHNLRTNPSVAFAYFKDCESLGVIHEISTYTAIISILFNSNQKQSLVSLFSNLISLNTDPGDQILSLLFSLRQSGGGGEAGLVSFTVDALLKAYITCIRAPQQAADVFYELGKLGFLPTLQSCNFLLSFVADAGDEETLFSVLDRMLEFSIKPDNFSFTILMQFLLNANKSSMAIHVWGLMEQECIKLDQATYETFLSRMCDCKRYDLSSEILQAMVRKGMQVRTKDFNIVFSGLCKESKLEEAEKLLQTMSVSLDHYAFECLISAYYKRGDFEKVLDLCEEMDSRGIEYTSIIVTHRLQCFSKLGMDNKVLAYFKEFKESGIVLDKVFYNIAINAYRRLGSIKEAMELIKEMRMIGLVPDTRNYTCLIAGFLQKREIVNARVVLAKMLKWGLKPDLITYNVLLSGFCRNGLVDAVYDILELMPLEGIELSVDTYCLVIKDLCIGKRVNDAEVLFNTLSSTTDLEAQIRYFSSMVAGYLCQGYTERAYKLFERFSEQGKLINEKVCTHLVSELCKEGKLSYASNVVREMLRAKQHNVFIFTTLMNGYCRAGRFDDACNLFSEMTDAGIEPNVVTYTVFLDGRLKEVLEMLRSETAKENEIYQLNDIFTNLRREMEGAKIEPDVKCYTVLIDEQCKVKRCLNDAQQLFDEMLSKNLRIDVHAYTALINGYRRKGKIKEARELYEVMVNSGLEPDDIASEVWNKVQYRSIEMQREFLETIAHCFKLI